MLCREYSFELVDLEQCIEVLCYPPFYAALCSDRVERLRAMGVEKLISFGRVRIGNISVLGKGHAALVALAKHRDHGVVAVKIRRLDSKRMSLVEEAEFLGEASKTGYAPRLYAYDDDFIVREPVDGPTLKDFVLANQENREALRTVFAELIRGAYALDSIGIEITEISVPLTQVVVECGDPTKPKFVDFESARRNRSSTNVTSIVGFIVGRSVGGKPIRELLGLSESDVLKLRQLARDYKHDLEKRASIVEAMIEVLGGRA